MKFLKMRYTVLLTALLISLATFADDFTLNGHLCRRLHSEGKSGR